MVPSRYVVGNVSLRAGVEKAFSHREKVARYAPDEGEVSGSYPLISHLR